MPKYLIEATYTGEGLRGLQKDKASGRRDVVAKVVKGLGGSLEAFYFSLGDYDVVSIMDLPDASAAAAYAITISASGAVRTKTTPLLTVEEVDRGLAKSVDYRPPRA